MLKINVIPVIKSSIISYSALKNGKFYLATKLFFTVMLGVWFALLLVGCNTVSGVGQDIQAGGSAITSSAQKTSQALTRKSSDK